MRDYAGTTDEDLVQLLREGDKLAEEQLYARYKQVVRSKAHPYFLVGADREDIIQEGMIGLYKAVCDFSHEKQTSFRAFADLCITRQILSAIKGATRKKHMPLNTYVSLNSTVFSGDSERPLIDMLEGRHVSDPEEVLIGRENHAALAAGIERTLSPLERSALTLYLKGYSYQQIADSLRRSVKSVDNAIQRVKKKLEEYLRDER